MRPFIDIGGLGDKVVQWNEVKTVSKEMTQKEAFDYIMQQWKIFLPMSESMKLFDDITNSYSLFWVIQSLSVMKWMIEIQKKEQKEYKERVWMNWDIANMWSEFVIRYGTSNASWGFKINESESAMKSSILWIFTGKENQQITVQDIWWKKYVNIDLYDIINTIFWTHFVQKIWKILQASNKMSLHIEVVYEEIDDYLISVEERNQLINEALYWMLDAFGKVTINPTP